MAQHPHHSHRQPHPRRRASLLGLSVWDRMAIVAAPLAALWVAVAWSAGWFAR